MPSIHPYGSSFIELMGTTQTAYAARDSKGYLSGFSEDYYSVQLDHAFEENLEQLSEKIARDIERFEILQMDFTIKRIWYAGEIGFAQLAYVSRLRFKGTERVILDRRENLVTGRHLGIGKWELICKTVLHAETVIEIEQGPDI
jgi:hypothetical protein